VGAAVDYSQASSVRTSLQAAIDAAVLGGVKDTTPSRNTTAANYFNAYLTSNKVNGTVGAPTFVTNADGSLTGNVSATVPTSFMSIVNVNSLTVSARGTAGVKKNISPACIIALDPSATPNVSGIIGAGVGGLNASGGGALNVTNCNIYVNSSSSQSINVTGGGSITADYVYTTGNYTGLVKTNKTTQPTTGAPATPDPYATRTIPAATGCAPGNAWSGSIPNSGTVTYCGDVTVGGATTLAPGVYIIKDGSLTSSNPISGTGVTIILTKSAGMSGDGVFDFKAGATLTLSAPTTGPTAGIALWADAALAHNADNFRAGTTGNITGAVYLPNHLVNYSGSASAGSACSQLIAKVIAISGGASFNHQCNGVGVSDVVSATGSAYLSN
jgi:hypothetical protein